MKRLALFFIFILIAFNLYADPQKVKFRLKNAPKDSNVISGTLKEVDFAGWRMLIETSLKEQVWVKFTDIKSSIYKLLVAQAENDSEKLFETARFMLFISKLDNAKKAFKRTRNAGFKDEVRIKEFQEQLNEFTAQELVTQIQAEIAEGDIKNAKKYLKKLKSDDYADTQAIRGIAKLEQLIERAESISKNSKTETKRDYEEIYTNAIKYFEDKLALGHEIYFKKNASSSSVIPWEEVVKNLDMSDNSGLIVDVYRFEQKQPEGLLRNRIKTLREHAMKILITTYKSLISFYLTRDSFKAAYEYLRKAVKLEPLDREILYFWYLYDEYKPVTFAVPKQDDDDDDKDK